MSDPAELVMTTDGSVPESKKDGDKVTEKSSTLRIEDRSFYVVSATLASMELLVDYLRLVINIELITTDVMSKIIEYLKVSLRHRGLRLGSSALTPTLSSFDSPSTLEPVRSFSVQVPCALQVSRTSLQSTSVRLVGSPCRLSLD